jgi:predicted nucleic acid-binding protein
VNSAARFLDTGYWIALVDESDRYHDRAVVLARRVAGPFVTTEAVLTEVGNGLAAQRWRATAITLLARIRTSPQIEVVPVTADLFAQGLDLYMGINILDSASLG